MTEAPHLERLNASDLFLLLWDDYGWSGDIGALAILDGTGLLDRDGRVRIEDVRRQLEPRLHLVPRFRQRLYRPRLGLGWPLWATRHPSTSPTTSESTRWPLPPTNHSCCRHAPSWRGDGWIRHGRCGSCGCYPACQSDRWACS
jgi:hypothetical protein